jgi:hypothetical protein
MKKNLLISYVVDDVESDIQAVSHLRALMYHLPEHYADKFEVFDVLDVEEVWKMNLDEFRKYVTEQRKASLAEALSVLTATISENKRKEN